MNDRLIRRAMRHLAVGEGLLASLVGHEPGGRRRQVVLATDRRVVISPTRPAPPREVGYGELDEVTGHREGALVLRTTAGEEIRVERITEPDALGLLIGLLAARAGAPAGHRVTQPPKVRIVST